MRRSASLCLGLMLLSSPVFPAFSAPFAQAESAEERYGFLVGLCDQKEWELAAREARGFLTAFPKHSKSDLARYRLATALFELDRKKEARDVYAELRPRENFEFRSEVLFRLGSCELALGRHAPAAEALDEVRSARGHYLAIPAEFFYAEAKFGAGDFAAAEQSYARVISAPEGATYARDARYGLAWCAFRTSRHDDVIARVEEFAKLHASDSALGELRYLQGEAQLSAGRTEAALASFVRITDGPFFERALRGAAFACIAAGDHAAAAARFETLLKRFPESEFAAEARLQRGIALVRGGDAVQGIAALRGVEDNTEASYWLARALRDENDAAAALPILDAALSARPSQEWTERLHVLRGDVLSDLGRTREAVTAYGRVQNEYALHAASISAFNAGDLDEAARLARSMLERFPKSEYAPEMRIVVGEAAMAGGRYDEAEQAFSAAASARVPATHARALSRVGWCRFLSGDVEQARATFTEVLRQWKDAPESNEARYMLGRCADQLGDVAAAIRAWREYLEQDPNGTHAASALSGLARLDAPNALQWSERLAESFPESAAAVGAVFDLAERAAKDGRAEDAQRGYRDVIARWPEHELANGARYGLAWSSYEAGEHTEAARALDQLLERADVPQELQRSALELLVWVKAREKNDSGVIEAHARFQNSGADARKLLGTARIASAALERVGRSSEAQTLFDDVLGRARGDRALQADILIESAWISIHAQHADDAEAAVRTAWKLGPSDSSKPALAEATFFVGELRFDAGEDERALELYALARPHGAPALQARALYKRGFVLLRAQRFDEAAQSFAALLDAHPKDQLVGESLYLLGDCRARSGQWEPTIAPLSRLVREFPKHASVPKALFRLAQAQGELGNWKESEASLAELARRAPNFEHGAEADLWRGRAAAQRGDDRAARSAFERVVASDRGIHGARARIELGSLAMARGEHEDALALFLKVALLYESGEIVAQATFHAAEALEALGQLDKAKARLTEVIANFPQSAFATRARARLAELKR